MSIHDLFDEESWRTSKIIKAEAGDMGVGQAQHGAKVSLK
jgi:hypothetical protein